MAYSQEKLNIVERAAAVLPQSTAGAIFTVTGDIILLHIVGKTTVEIGAGANNMKITANPTLGGSIDLCATADIDGDIVGTAYNITGTVANALVPTTPGGAVISQAGELYVFAGTIDLDCDASKAGEIEWTLHYIPLTPEASVVAA